jgi:hypothetical protein
MSEISRFDLDKSAPQAWSRFRPSGAWKVPAAELTTRRLRRM